MTPLMSKLQEIAGEVCNPPEKSYYINYHDSGEDLYIGPYAYTVAEVVSAYIKQRTFYVYPKLTVKPKKGHRKTTGPSAQEIEKVVTDRLKRYLEVYGRILDWIEQSSEEGGQ